LISFIYIKKYDDNNRYIDWASKLAILYGFAKNYKYYQLRETWMHEDEFDCSMLFKFKEKDILNYIYNNLSIDIGGKNIEQIMAIFAFGKIVRTVDGYSFIYNKNIKSIEKLLSEVDFPLDISQYNYSYNIVHNFIFQYFFVKKDVEYVCNILNNAMLVHNIQTQCYYAGFPKIMKNFLVDLGIPIEYVYRNLVMISPFWVSLTHFLVKDDKWCRLTRGYISTYPIILIKTILFRNYKDNIPYLPKFRKVRYVLAASFGKKNDLLKYLDIKRIYFLNGVFLKIILSYRKKNSKKLKERGLHYELFVD
jgi:hypothetical protein